MGVLYPPLEGDSEGCHLPPLTWTPAAIGLSGEAPVPRDRQQWFSSTHLPFPIPGAKAARTVCAESEPHSSLFYESVSSNSLPPRTPHAASGPCWGYPTIPARGQLTRLEIYLPSAVPVLHLFCHLTVTELLCVGGTEGGQQPQEQAQETIFHGDMFMKCHLAGGWPWVPQPPLLGISDQSQTNGIPPAGLGFHPRGGFLLCLPSFDKWPGEMPSSGCPLSRPPYTAPCTEALRQLQQEVQEWGGQGEPRALLSTLPSCPRGIVHRIPERIRARLSLPKESLVRNLTLVINPKDSVGICHLQKTNGKGYSE